MLWVTHTSCWNAFGCLHETRESGSTERHRRSYNHSSYISNVVVIDAESCCLTIVHRCLSNLLIRSPKKQGNLWVQQKRCFARTTALIKSLGKISITPAQAKKLDSLGLGYRDLMKLKSESRDREDFMDILKDRGVNSKCFREKLSRHFQLHQSTSPEH